MRQIIKNILREHTKEIKETKRFLNYDMNDDSFARLFHFFLTELKENEGFSHSKMKKAFELSLRMWTEKPPKIISKKVLDHFIENYPNINPFTAKYRPRNKYGIDLIFEHTTPVNNFVKKLLKSESLEDVKTAMREYSGMAIITLDEDRCLFKSGLSRQRPQGWEHAYTSCGIEIMDENQFKEYKNNVLNSQNDERID